MPLYGFKARWSNGVEDGTKPCTIRAKRKDGRVPKPGQTAHCYTGLRTKHTRLLRRSPIVAVDDLEIYTTDRIVVTVAGRRLNSPELEALARMDGHDSGLHMFKFFAGTHGLPFYGDLIKWDPTVDLRETYAESNPARIPQR